MPKITIELADEVVAEIRRAADEWGCTMTDALRRLIDEKRAEVAEPKPEVPEGICGLCGKPMPEGEEMFRYHGYSGPCPSDDHEGDEA